jgi:hypothetical protein
MLRTTGKQHKTDRDAAVMEDICIRFKVESSSRTRLMRHVVFVFALRPSSRGLKFSVQTSVSSSRRLRVKIDSS